MNSPHPNKRQTMIERLSGNPDLPRRPLTGYEFLYEIGCDGALYSIRLQRFLKPIFDKERGSVMLEFDFQNEPVRISPGKAVAISFFSPIQRERVAEEAYEEKPYDSFDDIKGHAAIDRLAYKYGVSDGAIMYIMNARVAKQPPERPEPTQYARRPSSNLKASSPPSSAPRN